MCRFLPSNGPIKAFGFYVMKKCGIQVIPGMTHLHFTRVKCTPHCAVFVCNLACVPGTFHCGIELGCHLFENGLNGVVATLLITEPYTEVT